MLSETATGQDEDSGGTSGVHAHPEDVTAEGSDNRSEQDQNEAVHDPAAHESAQSRPLSATEVPPNSALADTGTASGPDTATTDQHTGPVASGSQDAKEADAAATETEDEACTPAPATEAADEQTTGQ